MAKKCTKIYNARWPFSCPLNLFFGDVLIGIAVVDLLKLPNVYTVYHSEKELFA